jgi:hypothetical protein
LEASILSSTRHGVREAGHEARATASTDTGHVGGRGTFALDHPEKLIDFAWRSEHEMTVKVPGTELGWGVQALGPEPSANTYDQYRYVVFKDPKWDWQTFNFDSDVVRGDLPENLVMNATDPDMKPFLSHGGKLLLYRERELARETG